MLISVHVELHDDIKDVFVQFGGDDDELDRTFWIQGEVLLERVARLCLETRLDQMQNDRMKEIEARRKDAPDL